MRVVGIVGIVRVVGVVGVVRVVMVVGVFRVVKMFDQHVDVLICVLINTSAPSHWLKVSRDQLALSLNLGIFRTDKPVLRCF